MSSLVSPRRFLKKPLDATTICSKWPTRTGRGFVSRGPRQQFEHEPSAPRTLTNQQIAAIFLEPRASTPCFAVWQSTQIHPFDPLFAFFDPPGATPFCFTAQFRMATHIFTVPLLAFRPLFGLEQEPLESHKTPLFGHPPSHLRPTPEPPPTHPLEGWMQRLEKS